MKNSEVGHAKNVAQFRAILLHCEAFGQAYNPSNVTISITALQAALDNANASIEAWVSAKNAHDIATDQRETLFAGLTALGTRVTNTLAASGASPLTVDNAKTYLRKLRGQRAKKVEPVQDTPPENLDTENTGVPAEAGPALPRTVSTAQLSYDQRVSHFAKLVQVMRDEPLYAPNETELSVASLDAHLAALDAANQNVQQRTVNYENALIQRNKVLYAPKTGLTALTADLKNYVKALYGTTSEQYKRVAVIRVRNKG